MHLTLILGPMKSGKSFDLIHRFAPLKYTNQKYAVFQSSKHVRDEGIQSRSGAAMTAVLTPSLATVLTERYNIVGIDEIHMFPEEEVFIIKELLNQGTEVVVSGLDMDYTGTMFPIVKKILELGPSEVHYRRAVCEKCKQLDAMHTQVLKDGEPITHGVPSVIPEDGTYVYIPVCRRCFVSKVK